jgi:hypothetical protein
MVGGRNDCEDARYPKSLSQATSIAGGQSFYTPDSNRERRNRRRRNR